MLLIFWTAVTKEELGTPRPMLSYRSLQPGDIPCILLQC